MNPMAFNDLADCLKQGREIEFTCNGRRYSITNHSGFWHLCDDTDHILLETICRFHEKAPLISKIACVEIGGLTIQQIFDRQLYDRQQFYIL